MVVGGREGGQVVKGVLGWRVGGGVVFRCAFWFTLFLSGCLSSSISPPSISSLLNPPSLLSPSPPSLSPLSLSLHVLPVKPNARQTVAPLLHLHFSLCAPAVHFFVSAPFPLLSPLVTSAPLLSPGPPSLRLLLVSLTTPPLSRPEQERGRERGRAVSAEQHFTTHDQ